ncbi:MAG: hypothetical protein D6797_00280 [Bdellovibrio sp.]|nr:MAG: hypothetical protein D6797_00280 [Bdellovibrio sp.]
MLNRQRRRKMKKKMGQVLSVLLLPLTLGFVVTSVSAYAEDQMDPSIQEEVQKETLVVKPKVSITPQQHTSLAQPNVIQQPPTYVEASPLSLSKAELMRKKRQEAEIATEQKIVEKLEESRLEDERRRAERLFGNKNLTVSEDDQNKEEKAEKEEKPQTPQVVVVSPVPQPSVAPAPEKDLSANVKEDLKNIVEENKEKKNQTYVSPSVGMAEYLDCPCFDVKGNLAAGIVVGREFPSNFALEGQFIYSNYYVGQDYFAYKEMNQYNFGLAAKYLLKFKRVEFNVGGIATYTYRRYTNPYGTGVYYYGYPDDEKTYALDFGVTAGIDFNISDRIAVGFDYRYMMNITNRSNLDYRYYYGGLYSDYRLEASDYQVMSLVAKFRF